MAGVISVSDLTRELINFCAGPKLIVATGFIV
jgi:hypothetical protein